MEGLQRPVRRSEKKSLNEMCKSIRYKLDGPASKSRVQKPADKSFVLLQVAIGQLHVEDSVLQQEMTAMVDYALRMLGAVEEYSIHGSKNANVAIQSFKLRRSLAMRCWNSGKSALEQLRGVGVATATSLMMNGISTFADVLASSDENLERAAQRVSPFGMNLRAVVSTIMRSALKPKVEILKDGRCGSSVISCSLEQFHDVPWVESVSAKKEAMESDVQYSLFVYTDRPGSCLVYRRNISKPCSIRVQCPISAGRVVATLVASLVGLDGRSTIRAAIQS
jgi:Sec63 Brl domain